MTATKDRQKETATITQNDPMVGRTYRARRLTLPVQIGRRYVRRDGKIVTAKAQHRSLCTGSAYVGDDDEPEASPLTHVWLSTGRVLSDGDDGERPLDLVADAAVGGSTKPTEHQYAEVLRAIADGHRIQMQTKGGEWLRTPVDPNTVLLEVAAGGIPPSRFRIAKTAMYRVAEVRCCLGGSNYVVVASNENEMARAEASPLFIRWLTDRVEYEVTE